MMLPINVACNASHRQGFYVQLSKIPSLQFYAFGSAELGSMVATVGTGSHMSNKRQVGDSGPQHGLKTWGDRVSTWWQTWIMKERYGNEEAAINVARKNDSQFADRHFPVDGHVDPKLFHPKAFLVRARLTHHALLLNSCHIPYMSTD